MTSRVFADKSQIKAPRFALICQLSIFIVFGSSFAGFSYYVGTKTASMQDKLEEIIWEATRINSMSLGVDKITSEVLNLSKVSYLERVKSKNIENIELAVASLKKEFYAIDFYRTKSNRPLQLSRQVVSSTVRLSRAAGYIKSLIIKYPNPNDAAKKFLSSPILSEILEVKQDLAVTSLLLDQESKIVLEKIQIMNKNAQLFRIFSSLLAVVLASFATAQINKIILKPFKRMNNILSAMNSHDLNDYSIEEELPIVVNSLRQNKSIFLEANRINQDLIKFISKLVQLNNNQKNLSLVDPVTGLGGRLSFEHESIKIIDHCRRESQSICLMSIDIKNFRRFKYQKEITSDEVLRDVSAALLSVARRPLDQVFRIDGDEFAVILYGVDKDSTDLLIKEFHAAIAAIELKQNNKISSIQKDKIQIEIGFSVYSGKGNLKSDRSISTFVIKTKLVERAKLDLANNQNSSNYII